MIVGMHYRGRGGGGVGVVQHSEINHTQSSHLRCLPVPTSEVEQLFLPAISGQDAE